MPNVVQQDIMTAGTVVNADAARTALTSAGAAVVPAANAGIAVVPVTNVGTAVNLEDVSKQFTQWQRSGKFKDLLRNLVKPEKKVVAALDHVSLKVNNGEFVAYAGANGAGKSTTIKILSGILQPTSGAVTVLGMSPEKSRVELMKRIGVVFGQRTELWWDHPISVSFEWKKTVWNIPAEVYRHQLEMVTELLDLRDLLNTFARELSLGQRMRADLALMLLHNPELIFLDEPTLGLDVLAKRQMINFLKRINREQGTTIVVTSHDMDDLEEMAQRIVLLSRGQIAFDGSFDQLRELTGSLCRIRLVFQGSGMGMGVDSGAGWGVGSGSDSGSGVDSGSSRQSQGRLADLMNGGGKSVRLLAANHNSCEYEFDTAEVPVKDMLRQIAQLEGIIDIEISKAPIEQIVAELYTKWRG